VIHGQRGEPIAAAPFPAASARLRPREPAYNRAQNKAARTARPHSEEHPALKGKAQ